MPSGSTQAPFTTPRIWLTILVCGMGYFVDIYDLILFSIVRLDSLRGIGVSEANLLNASETVLQWQMIGMLLGGILFAQLESHQLLSEQLL